MTDYLALGVILVCAPVGLLLLHAVVSRGLRRFGNTSVPPQFVVLCTAVAGNIPVLYVAWEAVLKNYLGQPLDVLCGLMYVVLTYNCCCYLYFGILNLSETSLHVNILIRLLIEDGMAEQELSRLYGVKEMISARIERMIALGQLKEKDDRYFLGNGTLVLIGRLINIWRRILSLPLSPS
jgi:hypothetical protein